MYFRRLIVKHNLFISRCLSMTKRKPPWKVLFFGADDFSVYSLRALTLEYRKGVLLKELQVVSTAKGKPNAVATFCQKEKIPLLKWPPDIQAGEFDVGLVVSFGHLIPNTIIDKFPYGILNIHASLLPRWRGAAPIIYALAKGDSVTGVSIMRIKPKIFDTGDIVLQEPIPIHPCMKMGELHERLGSLGAKNLVKVLELLPEYLQKAKPQSTQGITYAPKITSSFLKINWDSMTSQEIFNLGRAVDGLNCLQTTWNELTVKLTDLELLNSETPSSSQSAGYIEYDRKRKTLKVLCSDLKFVTIGKVAVPGKKLMSAQDFNNGYVSKAGRRSTYKLDQYTMAIPSGFHDRKY